MGAKISCYTCQHYRPTGNSETGLCTILDDLAGPTYQVDSSSKECLYNFTTLPKVLTKSETKLRDETAKTKRREFWEHAQRCAEEVASWPEWKRRKRRVDLYEHCISLAKRTIS